MKIKGTANVTLSGSILQKPYRKPIVRKNYVHILTLYLKLFLIFDRALSSKIIEKEGN